jgi:hypothetical protein
VLTPSSNLRVLKGLAPRSSVSSLSGCTTTGYVPEARTRRLKACSPAVISAETIRPPCLR